jgi:hypothetical protein
MGGDRQDTWDSSKDVTKEDLERAQDDIRRERHESGYGRGMFDNTPEPSINEIWDRAERNKNPYPDRG